MEKDGKMAKIPGKTETIENVESAAFDPSEAAEHVRAVAEQGVELKVGVVLGDDLLDRAPALRAAGTRMVLNHCAVARDWKRTIT